MTLIKYGRTCNKDHMFEKTTCMERPCVIKTTYVLYHLPETQQRVVIVY